ncbi:sialate O-acetylesterase [Persicitalea sp.]|uniref:sialate O-acetylesterase n=1 Tax=Persicitalea sp. TaxID=3100273 RepID=UPI0035948E3C
MGKYAYISWLSIVLVLGIGRELRAQKFGLATFNQLPRDFQLYARDDSNQAVVPISGVVSTLGYRSISVVAYRNKQPSGYFRSPLTYAGKDSVARFAFKPKIKAELADYDFAVYVRRDSTDSTLVVRRDDIVAGDFYVFNGQSNAISAGLDTRELNFSSKYCRTLAQIPDSGPEYYAEDTLWVKSQHSWPSVGIWGFDLQRRILETYKIPTCVIKGAFPGTGIQKHIQRDGSPIHTIYDLLRLRVQKSGAVRIRAFFWLQGEEDVLAEIPNYVQKFDTLYHYWQQDYPMVDTFVVMQINLLTNPNPQAGVIRDFQRRIPALYPKTTHFATVGLLGYNGIHYSLAGYVELARQTFRFISPAVYGAPYDPNNGNPDIRKVFYTSVRKDTIVLEFDKGQEMRWPSDTVVTNKKGKSVKLRGHDQFFFDQKDSIPAPIAAYEIAGNRITLILDSSATAHELNYLPSFVDSTTAIVFPGPHLRNKYGLAAFSFHGVAINDVLVIEKFKKDTLQEEAEKTIKISWQPIKEDTVRYVLERKKELERTFSPSGRYDGKSPCFLDEGLEPHTRYTYRLRAVSSRSESPFIELTVTTDPVVVKDTIAKEENIVLSLNPAVQEFWIAYPNPSRGFLTVSFAQAATGLLQLCDLKGSFIRNQAVVRVNQVVLSVQGLAAGRYILQFRDEQGAQSSRSILVE